MDGAVNIAAEGLDDPWESEFSLFAARLAAELGFRAEMAEGVAGGSGGDSGGDTRDCLRNYCDDVWYCGHLNSDEFPLGQSPASPCLNERCFEHDRDSFKKCVRSWPLPCYFSPQSDEVDGPFLQGCAECLSEYGEFWELDYALCELAEYLKSGERDPLACCGNPACTGSDLCDCSVGLCDPNAGLCVQECSNHHLECGEECDDGNQVDGDGCSSTCLLE